MKEGWKYTTIGESCNINYGTRVVRSKDGGTIYDVYGGGGATFKMDTYNREDCLVVARFAMSKQCTRYVKGKFFLNDSGLTVSPKDGSNLSQTLLDKILLALNDTIYSFGRGSAQRNLNIKEFSTMKIAYPINLAEQEKFVSLLDAEFAKIDAIKANAEKQLQDAKALFQSALKDYLTPKEGWEESTIGEISNICGRIGFRGYTTKDMVAGPKDGAITLSPSNIKDGVMDYSKCQYISWYKYEESPEIMINNGDVLIVKTGSSYGKSAIVTDLPHKATINPQSVVIKNIKINNRFFAYLIRTPWIQQNFDNFVAGTAIPTFSQANLSKVILAYPDDNTQNKIVYTLDKISAKIQSLQSNFDTTVTLCNDLKQSILKDIFG